MTHLLAILAAGITLASPAWADFQPVREEANFRALVEGAELTRFAVRLQVLPQGEIAGRGFGRQVGGQWEWRNGYFCRTLEWGSGGDPYNCQLVLRDDDTLRFISDQGQGDQADFRLR